ncbi:hypothetical protein BD779DRAFT_1662234 [Infundibulicybe gibba]|nr:hypothetical protein BD779DRAFT_1662234 [Infundibulicybe gibba]
MDHNSSDPGTSSLPQYGFSTELDFSNLIKGNRFLFRVHTPKQRSPFHDDSEPFFVAPKFDERYTTSPGALPRTPDRQDPTYSDAARHMDWTTRSMSPYISTSFSFSWSIWEALRRYHINVKKDVEIAIIDGNAIRDQAFTAVQLLKKGTAKERHSAYWRWYHFSQESQCVLVYGSIPSTAVFASIPLLSIIDRMPSYFLNPGTGPLDRVAWNYTEKRPSYRQFCRDMSNRFLRLSYDERIKDATTGSVHLAVGLLRPWFYQIVTLELEEAILTTSSLALLIAQWPGQWWTRDHLEMGHLIRSIVFALAEELLNKQHGSIPVESQKLQAIITSLELSLQNYKLELSMRSPVTRGPGTDVSSPHASEMPFSPMGSAPLYTSMTLPLSPPPSPKSGKSARAEPIVTSSVPKLQEGLKRHSPSIATSPPLITPSPRASRSLSTGPNPSIMPNSPLTPAADIPVPPSPVTSATNAPVPQPPIASTANTRASPNQSTDEAWSALASSIPPTSFDELSKSISSQIPPNEFLSAEDDLLVDSTSILDTASCLVTGFVVGAFITLCILSPQRRALLTHMT